MLLQTTTTIITEMVAPYSEEMYQKKREYPHQIKVGNNTTDNTVNSEIENNNINPPAGEIIN